MREIKEKTVMFVVKNVEGVRTPVETFITSVKGSKFYLDGYKEPFNVGTLDDDKGDGFIAENLCFFNYQQAKFR